MSERSRYRAWVRIPLLLWWLASGPSFGAEVRWHDFPAGRWTELPARPAGGKPGFTLLDPGQAGIAFVNTLPEERGGANRTLYNGAGLATGDFDGDGLPDLVFAGLQGVVELYKNLGNWTFSNVTARSGIVTSNLVCRGVVLADINGDRALDLLLTTSGAGVRCFVNDGQGHFRDVTREAGTASPFGSMTLALADVDGNGSIDLYVANNRVEDIRDRGQVQLRNVGGKVSVPPALTNRLVFIEGRLEEYGEPDVLFLNDGHGVFRKVNWTGGAFLDESGQPLKTFPLDWGLSATFRDLNGDGQPDLYVCNDFWTPERIWLNDGNGKFQAAPTLAFRQTSGSSMGVDMAYLDGLDRPEIFAADMLSRSPAFRKRQMAAQPHTVNLPGVITNRPQSLRNTFFHPRADGTYEEMANYSGLSAAEWAWQPVFLDVDLDGRPDLLITSGHAHDVQDRDAALQVQARQKNYSAITNAAERQRVFAADLRANMLLYPPLRTPIVAFRNAGELRFEDVTAQWGTDQPAIHHGIALADFDGDGDLDFAVNNLNSPPGLYRNEAAGPRVAVRLIGLPPNTQAVGALATLRSGGLALQRQEIVAGGRYLSGSDALLVFAAGAGPRSLEIQWRNGERQEVTDIRADCLYEVRQGVPGGRRPAPALAERPVPLFIDASQALTHLHHETLYDDFQRQPLLPWRLSQMGPGVAWGDLDGDGWEDVVVGSGAGGKLGVFRNDQRGGFVALTNGSFGQVLPRDSAGLLILPGADARPELLAALASYEDGQTNRAALGSFAEGRTGYRPVFRDLLSSAGPLAAADMDGDGSLEVFIGARVQPARWPEATGSLLLRRVDGGWSVDEENSRVLNFSGCSSAAVWTDLNRDGFPELVLAGELGPIRIFKNERGHLQNWNPPLRGGGDLSGITNLAGLTGLWTSVGAGDFDGDGQLDLIVGNWGENGEAQASPGRPYTLVVGESGTPGLAVIEASYQATGALTPARPLEDLGGSLAFLQSRFRTFREYSEAPLEKVLGNEFSRFRTFSAATLKTVLLLNRGSFFEVRALPREAQLAPVFGISIADFDLDGREDLFLAQNFFALRPGVPRMDAGRGLLLRGDGRGGFMPVSGDESGVKVYGEQRGAAVADFNRDGKPDLVVTQNGAATSLFRNQSLQPGFRVRLSGPPGNPWGIGSVLRCRTEQGGGAAREIHGGAGYWSQDSAISTFALPPHGGPCEVEVSWPGGATSRHRLTPRAGQEFVVSRP